MRCVVYVASNILTQKCLNKHVTNNRIGACHLQTTLTYKREREREREKKRDKRVTEGETERERERER